MPSRWPSSAWGTSSAPSGTTGTTRRPRGSPRPSGSPPWPTGSRRSWPARHGRPTPPSGWRSPRWPTTRSGTPPPPGSGPTRWRPTRSSATTDRPEHRYDAACAAALAAAGRGEGEPPPDAAAKVELRRKALDWLRAELAAWSKVLDSADPKARAAVAPTLRHWKEDSDLTGVRDGDAIATLPADERRAWEALWKDVDALLKGEALDRIHGRPTSSHRRSRPRPSRCSAGPRGLRGMKAREAKIPPPGKPRFTDPAERVVRLYEEWGKKDKAAEVA